MSKVEREEDIFDGVVKSNPKFLKLITLGTGLPSQNKN